jgi:hypothetical protein
MSTTSTQAAERTEQLPQGDLRLLETDLAQQLLRSSIPARLAFIATDGTPRVVPHVVRVERRRGRDGHLRRGPDAGIRHPAARPLGQRLHHRPRSGCRTRTRTLRSAS